MRTAGPSPAGDCPSVPTNPPLDRAGPFADEGPLLAVGEVLWMSRTLRAAAPNVACGELASPDVPVWMLRIDICRPVQGSGFRVQDSGFRVQGSGFRVQGSGFKVQGSGFKVQGSGFSLKGVGCRVQDAGFGVYREGVSRQDGVRGACIWG